MAVIPESVEFNWSGATGSIDRDGPVEYTALWNIATDDPLDQAQTIIIWWQLNMFGLGFPYAYANDAFGSLATVANISPTRKMATGTHWIVAVKYSRESDDAKQTVGDEHTSDPLTYRPVINCSSNSFTRPGSLMIYRGGYGATVSAQFDILAGLLGEGGRIPPMTSAYHVFDPSPEIEEYTWYISVEQNLATFDGNKSFVGYTNDTDFTVDYKGLTRGPVAIAQSKIRDCEVSFERENTVDFWRVRYYFEVKADGDIFWHKLIDRDLMSAALPGKKDMHGGYLVDGQTGLPAPPGGAEATPILDSRCGGVDVLDVHGSKVRSPVLFDGDGEPLCPPTDPPVIGLWDEGLNTDFNVLPVIKEILAPIP